MYANSFTKVLVLVGCRVISNILGFRPSERKWKDYKHVQRGHRSRLHSDSSEKQVILYGTAKMHKNPIMGTICVYNWTYMMVDMGHDNIVHNDSRGSTPINEHCDEINCSSPNLQKTLHLSD